MSRAWLRALLAAWVLPVSAPADEIEAYRLVLSCLADAGGSGCIGVYANPCTATPDGQTTLGMTMCFRDEERGWDRLLNEEWADHMAKARQIDAANAPDAPASVADALREAQRAWIAFRDAECRVVVAQWGIGSMRYIDGAACALRMTGDRVLALRKLMEF